MPQYNSSSNAFVSLFHSFSRHFFSRSRATYHSSLVTCAIAFHYVKCNLAVRWHKRPLCERLDYSCLFSMYVFCVTHSNSVCGQQLIEMECDRAGHLDIHFPVITCTNWPRCDRPLTINRNFQIHRKKFHGEKKQKTEQISANKFFFHRSLFVSCFHVVKISALTRPVHMTFTCLLISHVWMNAMKRQPQINLITIYDKWNIMFSGQQHKIYYE